jgi:formyl-CoA transferase
LKDLFEILSKSGVPATPLYRVSDLLQDPHLAHRELISGISWRGSRLRVSLNPIRVDGLRPVAKGDPPELGEDTEEVLTKLLGISRDEIEGLRRAGVVV